MRKMRVRGATGLALLLFLQISPLKAEESHPGLGAESMYSEAVLAFNRKQSDEAIAIVDRLLSQQPNHVQALELKALALKEKGQELRSLEVYKKLIELKPMNERGPYYFQVGVILNDAKQPELAKPHFERALQLKFNELPSHLFLGLIGFASGDLAGSQVHFEAVRKGSNPELKVVAAYYLGLINFKNGYSAGGTSELLSAKAFAAELPTSKMASEISASTDKILEPFNVGQWFANVSLLSQYDTNIEQVPVNGSASSASASGQATPKMTFSAGVGKMGSPLSTVQLVGSFRTSLNRNLNSETHSYEYFSGTPSLYLNYLPLKTTNGGLKLEGTYMFQNQLQVGTTSYVYAPFNVAGEMGPYVRHNLDRYTQLEWDVYFRPVNYIGDDKQTGSSWFSRVSWRQDAGAKFFNPGTYLSYEKMSTGSLDYAYGSFGGGAYDVIRLSSKDTVNASVDLYYRNYPDASLARQDKNASLRANIAHIMSNAKYTLLGDVTYTMNRSNLDVYTYNDLVVSAGISWTM